MNIKIKQMEAAADGASDLLKALANRHRLMIACQLINGERAVGDLAAALGVRDSTVSQHLALLRKEGLVAKRRDGQTIHYSIANPAVQAIIKILYKTFCTPPERKR